MDAIPEPGSLLIVDDDPFHRATLRRYLEKKGLAVSEAAGGTEALAALARQAFDVILLDVVMPGLSGFQVLETVRRQHPITALPIIMATAKDEPADVVEALRLGANDYVTKPFDVSVVLARVLTQVSLKRSVERITRLELSLEQRNADLENANRLMRRDLEAAARVQQSLLPKTSPEVEGVRFAWKFRPCAELAGDLLNIAILDGRHAALYVFDVVGHGTKAAMLAVMVSRALTQLLVSPDGSVTPPTEVAARLNEQFPWEQETSQFFTLLYGVLSVDTGEFRFISAGHPEPLHLARGQKIRSLPLTDFGSPIGLGDGRYEETRFTLQKGDRLYLYSDGLPDVLDENGKRFGEEKLHQALERVQSVPLGEGLSSLLQGVGEWCNGQPHDDISVLAVERA